jgi:hypothetical protein
MAGIDQRQRDIGAGAEARQQVELLEDEAHLLSILHEGSRKAREVAAETINSTYRNLGIVQ